MKGLIVALLVFGACACAPRSGAERETLDSATLSMRRGELDKALGLADQGVALTSPTPGTPASEWAWRFVLLRGEILIRKRDLPAATAVLSTAPPSEPGLVAIRARHEFLKAYALLVQNRLPDGLATLARAREIAPDAPEVRFDVDVLDGQIRYQLGRPEEADARLNDVLQAATKAGDRYHRALSLLALGMGRFTRFRYDEALARFEQVLELNELSEFEVYATALNNAGICHAQLGQFDRAVAMQQRAVALHEHRAQRGYEQALGQLGTTYLRWNNVRDGLPYLRRALAVATTAGLTADAAIWAGNLADAHIELGEWEEAERFTSESKRLKTAGGAKDAAHNTLRAAEIAVNRREHDEAAALFEQALANGAGDPSVRWSAHEGLAGIALAAKQPVAAARHFEAALDTIEKTRADLLRPDDKLSFFARLISFYRKYVDALIDQGQIERALEVADSSRGRVLAERQGVAPAARVRAAVFRERAAQSNTIFLSYWLGPARSYLWIVSPARVEIVTLPAAQVIEGLVREYRAAIDKLADPLAGRDTAGDTLFQMLVQPALRAIPKSRAVLVVPDGALYALNLETLPVGGERRHYWIEDVELQISPSLAMLDGRPTPPLVAPAATSPSLLLIGNPTPRNPEFPALKYAAAEMTSIASHFAPANVASYQAERAVPTAYGEAHPERFSFVHFTAHATANVDSPLDSAVVLAGPDEAFKLYAREVAAGPLRADLVTVSACRSAGERTYSGEGLVGFAWAFLRGGARRVIAGLWDVDDRSTAELMDLLYSRLAQGAPPVRALREAKLTLLRRGGATAKPYYWAPFELFTLSP